MFTAGCQKEEGVFTAGCQKEEGVVTAGCQKEEGVFTTARCQKPLVGGDKPHCV